MPEAPWLFDEGLVVDGAVDKLEVAAVVGNNFGAEVGVKEILGQGLRELELRHCLLESWAEMAV